jgi:hypothetical protein
MTIEQEPVVESAYAAASDEQLVAMLVDRARGEGLQLTSEGGLLQPADQAGAGVRPEG